MTGTGTDGGYGPTAKALHWLVAVLLVGQYWAAWTMERLEEGVAAGPIANLHASLGITILAIVLVRLAWRILHPVAQLGSEPAWQRRIAFGTHAGLYVVLIAVPLLGLVMAMAEGAQLRLYGFLPLPGLPPAAAGLGEAAEEGHELFAIGLLALVGMHLAAALYHYLVKRDQVLQRMLPSL